MNATKLAGALALVLCAAGATRGEEHAPIAGVVDASNGQVSVKAGGASLALSGDLAGIFARFPGQSVRVVGDPAAKPFVLDGVVAVTSATVFFDPGYADAPAPIGTLAAGTLVPRIVDAIPVPADGPPGLAGKTLLRIGIPFDAVQGASVSATDFMASNASAFVDASAIFAPAPPPAATPSTGLVQKTDDGVTVATPNGPLKLTGSLADALSKLAGKTVQLAGDGSRFAGLVTQEATPVFFDPGYADAPVQIGTLPAGTVVPVLVDAIPVPADGPPGLAGKTLLRVGIPFDAVQGATVGRSDFMASNASVFIDSDAISAPSPEQPRVGIDRALDGMGR